MGKKILLTFLISGFILVSASSQQQWPTKEWAVTTPQKLDLIADSLIALDKDFANGKYGHVNSMLVIRHGKIAYEKTYSHNYAELYKQEAKEESGLNSGEPGGPYNYFNSWWHPYYHETKLHTQQSVSKTITSMIIGVAITKNDFPDINTPVLHFFDTTSLQNIDSRKRKMTIRHLLTMTAGFDWNESLPYSDPKNDAMIMEASLDWPQYVINKPDATGAGGKI
jgi:CubicO group peptidase (beta-lactamase class C family)